MTATLNGAPGVLRDILRRLELLEQQTPPRAQETLQPTFQTLDAAGNVGAVFPGGVQLIEQGAGTYNPETAVGFLDAVTDVIRSFLFGFAAGNSHSLILKSNPDLADFAEVYAQASSAPVAGSSLVAGSVIDGALAGGSAGAFLIMDSAGHSDFLQIATRPGNVARAIAGPFDTGVLGGAGIVQFGDVASASIAHNLNNANPVVIGHTYDGFFSSLAGWRAAFTDANHVTIHIGNNSNRAVTAGLRFHVVG